MSALEIESISEIVDSGALLGVIVAVDHDDDDADDDEDDDDDDAGGGCDLANEFKNANGNSFSLSSSIDIRLSND